MWVLPHAVFKIHRRCQHLRPGSAPVASGCEDGKVERIDVPIAYRPNVLESMIRRTLHAMRFGWVLAILLGVTAPAAHADGDRVAELSAQLDDERTEKERIAAVTALGRLNDKKALKPLVGALRDKSATVRAVAALALGKLGHRAALPALREAQSDDDSLVRKRAKEAVTLISEANDIEPEYAEDGVGAADKGKAGFGNKPKALSVRPELYVVVKSATDDSTAARSTKKADQKTIKKDKKMHAEIAKLVMSTELKATEVVTSTAKDAAKYNLDLRNIDVIITKLDTRTSGNYIEVEAQLRLAISDDRGKMLSFLTGGAKVQVKKATYNTSYLPQLRREAIENAVRGLFDKLMAHLRRGAGA